MNAGIESRGQSEELTFIELIRVLTEYRLVVLGVSVVVIIIALLFAFLSKPVYRAEVLIAPADESSASAGGISSIMSRIGGIAGLGGLSRFARQDALTQGMVTLGSPQFAREYIKEKNLLPVLFAGKWDAENEEWTVTDKDDIPNLADGYMLFKKEILDVVEEDTGVVTVAIEWYDPELAAEWANELVSRLNQKLRVRAIEESNHTIEYLNQEAEKTRIVELRQAIYFMIENQINLRTMANVREEFSFKVISSAIAPEEDQFVRPNRLFILIIALVIGPALGVFFSFLIFAIKRIRAELQA
ncbi:MAG: hypothetical protein HKN56_10985 [Gammaproteobacteria bacterium]|nr:hypothetical protein [Gammaproteobacteria bacterium]